MINSSPCYANTCEIPEPTPKKSRSVWDIIIQALEIFNRNSHYLSPTSPQAAAIWVSKDVYSHRNLVMSESLETTEKAEYICLK